ncbi:MAG: Rrf2 family transcriptional regulator [Armatimonas sp.]
MTFTAKEDYGLRAILDIAANSANGPVQAREIAQRQRIPEQFLEQLLATMRRAELIRSIRGAGGGYILAMDASNLRVGDILRALSGPLVPHDLSTPGPEDSPETAAVRESGTISARHSARLPTKLLLPCFWSGVPRAPTPAMPCTFEGT